MLLTKLKLVAAVTLTAVAIAVGATVLTQQNRATAAPRQEAAGKEAGKPERSDSFSFQRVGLSADDVVDATGLVIFTPSPSSS